MSAKTSFIVGMLLITSLGCGGDEPYRKTTSPVKGKVTVDGQPPGSGIQILCHPDTGPDAEHPTASSTETDADGVFAISTYTSGDGMPVGNYTLTFTWQEYNIISRSYSGKDKLNDRYSDPEKSTFKISVKEGEENDMGTIALTTK